MKKIDIIYAKEKIENNFDVLESILNINEYLNVYGVRIKNYKNKKEKWEEIARKRKSITQYMANFFSKKSNEGFLRFLNFICKEISDKNNLQHRFKWIKKNQKELLQKCVENNLIQYDNDKEIQFNTKDVVSYFGGFWFEEYVYFLLKDFQFDEVMCGVEIYWNDKTNNELDIVVVHNNRLLIIECKTRKYNTEKEKDNETFYKFDSIAEDLRGLYGEKWLLSVCRVEEDGLKRAKSQGIKVFSGNDIQEERLKEKIKEWKERSLN